jgi:DHA1 family multidrug resistance protein-like MFS transporter
MTSWKRTLAVMFVAQFLTAVGFSMIFPFLPTYVEALGTNTDLSLVFWAGAVFSAQGLTLMIASPIWGALADRWGRKPMVQRALFGGAALLLLMGYARSAEELTLLRALQGAVTGVVSAGSALVASVTPPSRTGYALGALQTALWSGVALGPLMGGLLVDLYGFRAAFTTTAALLLIGGVVVQIGVREEFTPPKEPGGFGAMVASWRQLFATAGVAATFAARFSAWLARGVLVPILPLFVPLLLMGQGLVATFTGLVIGIASATGTVSALILGRMGDRLGHRRILIWAAVAAAVAYLPMALVTRPWQLLALNALAGVAVGGVMPALSTLLARHSARSSVGAAFGIDNAVVGASRAAAPLIGVGLVSLVAGALGQEAGYRAVFGLASGLFALTVVVALVWLPPAERSESG